MNAARRLILDRPWPLKNCRTGRRLTTAYAGVPSDGRLGLDQLSYLPFETNLPGSRRRVQIDAFEPSEWSEGMDLMNHVIREGRSWPFETEFTSLTDFRAYFLSHAAFRVRDTTPTSVNGGVPHQSPMMGCFYIKPNFPGRCSHVCNGGFITAPDYRRQGVARLMGHVFLQAARDLGYRSAYFNLVFASNVASIQLWESLGFEQVAVLREAARLKGVSKLDTAYGYRYDLATLPPNYLQNALMSE